MARRQADSKPSLTSHPDAIGRHRRSLGVQLFLGLSLGLSLSPLLGQAGAAGAAEPLRLAVSMSPLSLPIFVADKQGYFAAAGLKLQWQEVVGGHRAMQLLLDGKADLATSSEAVVMFNSFKPAQFAVLASFVSSNDGKLVLRPGSGVSRIKDLVGKRVGTVLGTSSHYMLDTMLLAGGVDPKSVQIMGLQPEAMADLLRSGEVDAVAIWEPLPFKLLQGVPGSQILPTAGSYRLSFNLIVAKSLAGQRDEELQKVLHAIERAQRFIANKPKQAQAILRERLKLDQAFVDWIWSSHNFRLSLDQSLLSIMEAEARWARQQGHIQGISQGQSDDPPAPNFLDFIYSKPLRKVLPTGVSLIE